MVLLRLVPRWEALVPATNNFMLNDPGINAPYSRATAVTLSDSQDLAEVTRAINVHKTGATSVAVKVTMAGDGSVVTLNIGEATTLPVRVSRVWLTGTDASATVVALY